MAHESISNFIRDVAAELSGDVKHNFRPSPYLKPPRRRPSIRNKSQRIDYMKEYMRRYRENGNNYQKVPESVKEFRRKQKKRLKERFNLGKGA